VCEEELVLRVQNVDGFIVNLLAGAEEVYADIAMFAVYRFGRGHRPQERGLRDQGIRVDAIAEFPRKRQEQREGRVGVGLVGRHL
jgi:hypothetical protein